MERLFLEVSEDDGERIDVFLSDWLEDRSRSFVQKLISDEAVRVNGNRVKSSYKVRIGDHIELMIPQFEELNVSAENIDLNVIFEDRDLMVVYKPQGMVVHPAPGNYSGTLVNALLYHCTDLSGINGVLRPGIVHRIDKDTSGLLMVAKSELAHNSLSAQLKDHSVKREYLALVNGNVKSDNGVIETYISRNPKDRLKMAVNTTGKHAITHYKVVERFKFYSLIEASLETGRTHQIRVHMSHLGHSLVGDKLYGKAKEEFSLEGQLLHAKTLGFLHPRTGEALLFDSELPSYFSRILETLRRREFVQG